MLARGKKKGWHQTEPWRGAWRQDPPCTQPSGERMCTWSFKKAAGRVMNLLLLLGQKGAFLNLSPAFSELTKGRMSVLPGTPYRQGRRQPLEPWGAAGHTRQPALQEPGAPRTPPTPTSGVSGFPRGSGAGAGSSPRLLGGSQARSSLPALQPLRCLQPRLPLIPSPSVRRECFLRSKLDRGPPCSPLLKGFPFCLKNKKYNKALPPGPGLSGWRSSLAPKGCRFDHQGTCLGGGLIPGRVQSISLSLPPSKLKHISLGEGF